MRHAAGGPPGGAAGHGAALALACPRPVTLRGIRPLIDSRGQAGRWGRHRGGRDVRCTPAAAVTRVTLADLPPATSLPNASPILRSTIPLTPALTSILEAPEWWVAPSRTARGGAGPWGCSLFGAAAALPCPPLTSPRRHSDESSRPRLSAPGGRPAQLPLNGIFCHARAPAPPSPT